VFETMRRLQVAGLLVLGVFGAGYFSAVLSRNACEDRVARDIAQLAGRPAVHLLPDSADASVILERVGLTATVCDPLGPLAGCAPLALLERAHVVGPGVVSIRWGFNKNGNMGGYGGRRRFLCLLGLIFELKETDLFIG
jgi:hypothetical protein